MQQLTDTDKAMLEFERSWWQYTGSKEQEIRDRFDLSVTAYYMRLNRLLQLEAAIAFDPLVVKRLLRLREERQASRSARRLGFSL